MKGSLWDIFNHTFVPVPDEEAGDRHWTVVYFNFVIRATARPIVYCGVWMFVTMNKVSLNFLVELTPKRLDCSDAIVQCFRAHKVWFVMYEWM